MMEIALGVLKWPPGAFWTATPHEFSAALDGHLESIGARKSRPDPMTSARLDDLRRRFPD